MNQICQGNLEVILSSQSVNWGVQENIRGSSTLHVIALIDWYQESGFSGVSGLVAQLDRVAVM